MKLNRALDPLTQAVILAATTLLAGWMLYKVRSVEATMIFGGLALFTGYRLSLLNEEYPRLFVDDDWEGEGVFYNQEYDNPNILSPGMSHVADRVEIDSNPGRVYKIKNGTSAGLNAAGEIETYSPISKLLTPNGWQKKVI